MPPIINGRQSTVQTEDAANLAKQVVRGSRRVKAGHDIENAHRLQAEEYRKAVEWRGGDTLAVEAADEQSPASTALYQDAADNDDTLRVSQVCSCRW